MPEDTRRTRGKEVLATLHGATDGDAELSGLASAIGDDLAQLTTDFCLGDIWTRPHLDRKTRSLVVIAALTALGKVNPLAVHVRGAINHGATPDEVREVIVQMAAYAGFPAAVSAAPVVEAALAELRE